MSKQVELKVPDLGDFSDVEVIELLSAPGERVEVEEGLVSLETDKAAMDVPATEAGTLIEYKVAIGDRVSMGDVIAIMEVAAPAAADDTTATVNELAKIDGEGPATFMGAGSAAAGEPTVVDLVVPDIGDFADVEVIEVLVAPGDNIAEEDSVVTLETDKASMDIPSTATGEITEVLVSVGAMVSQGSVIARIAAQAKATPESAAPAPATAAPTSPPAAKPSAPARAAPATSAPKSLPPVDETGFARAHASPSVRKLARELGVSLGQVKGTERKGRISHDDVKRWVKEVLSGSAHSGGGALPAVPKVDFAAFGPTESQKLTRIQKISGPRLQASWINLPHVTQHDQADITDLEARRQELKGPAKERGIGLTPLAFVIRAVLKTLNDYPVLASSLSPGADSLVMKSYRHIGFAADTPQGLVVPVIRNADRLDVYELAGELGTLSAAAREGKLKADQMQGAVFTISSLGGIGGTAFTPIVNAPEVAILGVSRSTMQPVWDGQEFKPRLMLPLSLSYDHRVVDGALAVRFTTRLGEYLSDVTGLIEATP